MRWGRFFEVIIEPAAPLLARTVIAHNIRFDRREFIASHTVSKYVLADFDRRLSGHLSALHGEGLPQAAVDTQIRDLVTGRAWAPFPRRYCASPAAALTTAAKLALGSEPRITARVGTCGSPGIVLESEQIITPKTIAALERALNFSDRIGAPDFVDATADLDRVLVRPRESQLLEACIDLHRETICIPATEKSAVAVQEPLPEFADAVPGKSAVATWLAQAHQATALLREEAVRLFLASAEQRVFQMRAAIGDRPLTENRMEVVSGLISRLQAGLGLSLAGLNEAAQITAFDWAASLRGDPEANLMNPA